MSKSTIDILFTPGPVEYLPPPVIGLGGGECVFLGRTRGEMHDKHGPLQLLRYTAYESMAKRVLESLAQIAIKDHGALFVRIHHRMGEVPVGQASVLVQVVCGHRAEAFEACRMLIDRLKSEAPIWKSEVWADGTTWSRGLEVPQAAFADDEDIEDEEQA